jgi:hypothetical protein
MVEVHIERTAKMENEFRTSSYGVPTEYILRSQVLRTAGNPEIQSADDWLRIVVRMNSVGSTQAAQQHSSTIAAVQIQNTSTDTSTSIRMLRVATPIGRRRRSMTCKSCDFPTWPGFDPGPSFSFLESSCLRASKLPHPVAPAQPSQLSVVRSVVVRVQSHILRNIPGTTGAPA